jgi:hypothetical protein
LQKDPEIKEFREKPLANAAELGEIFEGVQATGDHAIYPAEILRGLSEGPPQKKVKTEDVSPGPTTPGPTTPRARVRERAPSSAAKLLAAVERLVDAPAGELSARERAVTKLRKGYKGKEGWSTRDLLAGYKLFQDTVKAEVFLGLDGGEDEEEWLRLELDML